MGKSIDRDKTTSIIDLARTAGDELRIEYVKITDLANYFLEGNSKLHDIGGLSVKFQKYGYVDPLKIDPSLNGGRGGIVGGNGGLETLIGLYESGESPPRGIKLDSDRNWYSPVIIGVNAKNEREAIALSVDLNLAALDGGNFTALDKTRLFDSDALLAQLQDLADNGEMVTSIDGDDLDFLIEQLSAIGDELEFSEGDDKQKNTKKPPEDFKEYGEDIETKHECPKCGYSW